MDGVRVIASATKRGISESDILHALRHPLRFISHQGDAELTMVIGPARNGRVLEIGLVEDEGETRVIHAMAARPKYWP